MSQIKCAIFWTNCFHFHSRTAKAMVNKGAHLGELPHLAIKRPTRDKGYSDKDRVVVVSNVGMGQKIQISYNG